MPRDYLLKIAHATLPIEVADPYEVRCVHVLQAAELVEATVTPATQAGGAEQVVVQRITAQGRAEIERIRRAP